MQALSQRHPDPVAVQPVHLTEQAVAFAEEPGDVGGGGMIVEGVRRAHLQQHPFLHDAHAVGQGHRLVLIVRDEQEGDAEGFLHLHQLLAQRLAERGVEGGERLVEQQDFGLVDERPRQRHPLRFAAAQPARVGVFESPQVHDLQQLLHPLRDFRLRHFADAGADGDVVVDGHVRKQGVVLEDEPHRPPLHGQMPHLLSGDIDFPLVRRFETGEDAQQGGFAAAAAAEQDEAFPRLDLQRQAAEHRFAVEGFGYGFEPDHWTPKS